MRRKLTKVERQRIYAKCGGHCGYCGTEIDYKDMQVDHIKPLKRSGSDTLDNMLPACRSCNHYKATLTVEEYRKYLSGIPNRLTRDSIPFQVGLRFGIVEYSKNDPIFYFEKMDVEGKTE